MRNGGGGGWQRTRLVLIGPTIGLPIQKLFSFQAGGDCNVPSYQQLGPDRHCIKPGFPGGVYQGQFCHVLGGKIHFKVKVKLHRHCLVR